MPLPSESGRPGHCRTDRPEQLVERVRRVCEVDDQIERMTCVDMFEASWDPRTAEAVTKRLEREIDALKAALAQSEARVKRFRRTRRYRLATRIAAPLDRLREGQTACRR